MPPRTMISGPGTSPGSLGDELLPPLSSAHLGANSALLTWVHAKAPLLGDFVPPPNSPTAREPGGLGFIQSHAVTDDAQTWLLHRVLTRLAMSLAMVARALEGLPLDIQSVDAVAQLFTHDG